MNDNEQWEALEKAEIQPYNVSFSLDHYEQKVPDNLKSKLNILAHLSKYHLYLGRTRA